MATILVVDDRSINREFLAALLGYAGHRVLEAADGSEALASAQRDAPALIITDLMMPVMDGLELAATLRASESYRHIPIIMMTSLPTAVAEASGLFDVVLRKPFTPEALMRAMATCFEDRATVTDVD